MPKVPKKDNRIMDIIDSKLLDEEQQKILKLKSSITDWEKKYEKLYNCARRYKTEKNESFERLVNRQKRRLGCIYCDEKKESLEAANKDFQLASYSEGLSERIVKNREELVKSYETVLQDLLKENKDLFKAMSNKRKAMNEKYWEEMKGTVEMEQFKWKDGIVQMEQEEREGRFKLNDQMEQEERKKEKKRKLEELGSEEEEDGEEGEENFIIENQVQKPSSSNNTMAPKKFKVTKGATHSAISEEKVSALGTMRGPSSSKMQSPTVNLEDEQIYKPSLRRLRFKECVRQLRKKLDGTHRLEMKLLRFQ